MEVKFVRCRSALSRSGLEYDYALNPYIGCAHSCVYCYAPYVLRIDMEWGTFVHIKQGIPRVLSKEVRRRRKGVVGIGTVTDAYQPVEREHELTRKCIEILLKNGFPVCIQTKSSLVTRDIDLIENANAEVGFTITGYDDEIRKAFEPHSSSIDERLAALREISERKVKTWVFIGPLIPGFTEEGIEKLIREISRCGARSIIVDRLNLKRGLWDKLRKFLEKYDPSLIPVYESALFGGNYFIKLRERIRKLCKENSIHFSSCF